MVIVKDSGKSLIHIIDNGIGMDRDDLALSCRRHATSKIYTSEDLESIKTFGFRGEALASIASVANVEIRTRQQDQEHGWRLTSEPLKEQVIEPFQVDIGTQIFVRNLFFNIPVRKKFLKTNLTEFRYISETMLKFALAKPKIRFVFYDNDSLIFDVKPDTLFNRIKDVIGESTSKAILPLSYEEAGVKISGYIGLPSIAKQSRANQYLYLNSRSIQSKSISYAIFAAYEHLLEKSKNPFYVINIELDPKEYDVNVHPQKHEVKFEDERLIHNMMNRAVVKALSENSVINEVALDSIDAISPFQRVIVENEDFTKDRILVNKVTGEIVNKDINFNNLNNNEFNNNINKNWGQSQNFNYKNQFDESNYTAFKPNYTSKKSLDFDINIFKADDKKINFPQLNKENEVSQSFINQDLNLNYELLKKLISGDFPMNFLQIHNKYIIIEAPNGILMFDQHAAHERVLYERVLEKISKKLSTSQELLFSQNLVLDNSEILILNEINAELTELGYRFELKGNNLEIFSVPLDDAYNFGSISIKEVIDQYTIEQKIKNTDKRDYLAASIACKSAIKTGKKMSKEEVINLLKQLLECDMPYCCPHGRPIVIELSLYRLDKLFGRII